MCPPFNFFSQPQFHYIYDGPMTVRCIRLASSIMSCKNSLLNWSCSVIISDLWTLIHVTELFLTINKTYCSRRFPCIIFPHTLHVGFALLWVDYMKWLRVHVCNTFLGCGWHTGPPQSFSVLISWIPLIQIWLFWIPNCFKLKPFSLGFTLVFFQSFTIGYFDIGEFQTLSSLKLIFVSLWSKIIPFLELHWYIVGTSS